jgi:hypothetical protein
MFRHAVSRGGTRFKPVAGFEIPMDFTVELEVTADDHEITVEDPNQPRQDATAARNLMRHLGDPRYYMAAVLATVLNAKGAMRACRSQVRVDANGVAIRHNNGSAERPQWTWYELDASAAAFMRWLLAGPYAPLESERRAGGPDYRLVADVRWDGVRAQRIRALSDMPDPEADALLDPSQVAPLAFTMRVGYLAAYERAYRAGEIRDYPLFPEGMLRKGRAAVLPKAKPIDRKVISRRWAADARRILGLPKMEGDAMYGWRRCLMDLHERWDTDARVKDLLVGHGAIRNPEQRRRA